MVDNSHKTAIKRKTPSAPVRFIVNFGYAKGRCLDYGCGHGLDADTFGFEKYDKYYNPKKLTRKYDTIVCTYVLNTVKPKAQREIIEDIKSLLKQRGTAYITVRRRVNEGKTKKDTYQCNVKLDLPIVDRTSWYTIYRLSKKEVANLSA